MKIIDFLTDRPQNITMLIEKSGLPKSTIYYQLAKLKEKKIIVQIDEDYLLTQPLPKQEDIIQEINLWLGQKRMDNKYRKKMLYDQILDAFVWYTQKNPKPQVFGEEEYEELLYTTLTRVQQLNKCY
jgi:hypothetical protein